MKKFVAIFMVIMMMFAMTACSTGKIENSQSMNSTISENFMEDNYSTSSNNSSKAEESNKGTNSSIDNSAESSTESSKPENNANNSSSKPAETSKPETSKTETHTHTWTYHAAETVTHEAWDETITVSPEQTTTENVLVGYKAGHQYATFKDGHTIYPCDPKYNYNAAAYNQAIHDYADYCNANGINSAYSYGPVCPHTYTVEEYNSISWEFDIVEPKYDTVTTTIPAVTNTIHHDAWVEIIKDEYYSCSCGATK